MQSSNKTTLSIYNLIVNVYCSVKKKYPKLLPVTPLSSRMFKPVFILMTKAISKQFDSVIQEELKYYMKNHYELEDLQDGLDMGNLLTFVKNTENLNGDILELGTYKGGTTVMMANFLKKIKSQRKIFSCDAFIGLPFEDRFSEQKNVKGMFGDANFDKVLQKFQTFNVDDKIDLIKGLFEETLDKKLSKQKFSFVLLDCDIYDSAKYCLEFVYPRLEKGGIIMFDDYDRFDKDNPSWGETTAVNEFCATRKIEVNLHPVPHIKK